jgi:hypothetical protein
VNLKDPHGTTAAHIAAIAILEDRFGLPSAERSAAQSIEWAVAILREKYFYFGREAAIAKTKVVNKRHWDVPDQVETCVVEVEGVCTALDGDTITVKASVPMEQVAQHRPSDRPRFWQVSRGLVFGSIDGVECEMRFSQADPNMGDDYWIRPKGSSEPWLVSSHPNNDFHRHKPKWVENPYDWRLKES